MNRGADGNDRNISLLSLSATTSPGLLRLLAFVCMRLPPMLWLSGTSSSVKGDERRSEFPPIFGALEAKNEVCTPFLSDKRSVRPSLLESPPNRTIIDITVGSRVKYIPVQI